MRGRNGTRGSYLLLGESIFLNFRMRMTESGVGLAAQMTSIARGTVPIMNDNSKYSGNFLGIRKAGPPPGRRMTGSIDVIGGTAQRATPTPVGKAEPPKMNVIQVLV